MRKPFEVNAYNETNLKLKGYLWAPSESSQLRGALVIAHGMAETILRYDAFAEYLTQRGLAVFGYSHRGHFETAGSLEKLGYLGEDGWSKMAADLGVVVALAKDTFPGLPVAIFGHSMGSYVTRTYLLKDPQGVEAIILSGTGYPKRLDLQAAVLVARIERRLKGADLPSKLLDKLSFGAFNNAFKPNKTPFDWLSSDAEQVQRYIDNPWCGQIHPTSFFEAMAQGLIPVLYGPRPHLEGTSVPMLVMSGALDPVGQMGKGVTQSADFYREAGYAVTLKLYKNGRHEMLNEVNCQAVFEDVWQYLAGVMLC